MKIKGNIVITDPCYMVNSYNECYMKRGTIYGDWSCMVYPGKFGETDKPREWDEFYFEFFEKYNSGKSKEEKDALGKEFEEYKRNWKKNETLGEFCADSGNVGVFDYDNLNEENKEFIRTHDWCAAVIKDFDGVVEFFVDDNDNLHVIGTGNKDFFTTQSGL